MPALPTWIHELPRIAAALHHLPAPVVDRATVEKLFGVRRRRAIQLMHYFGGYQAGRTFLVEKSRILEQIEKFDYRVAEQEVSRRTKLVAEIQKAKAQFPARHIRVTVPAAAQAEDHRGLPPNVDLQPGELRIRFQGAEDLLRQLAELTEAMAGDFERYRRLCEGS